MLDHVHLQVHLLPEVPPTVPLSRFVGLLKGRSSRLLRMAFPQLRRLPARWSLPWVVSTVGGVPLALAVARRYVQNQQAASRR